MGGPPLLLGFLEQLPVGCDRCLGRFDEGRLAVPSCSDVYYGGAVCAVLVDELEHGEFV